MIVSLFLLDSYLKIMIPQIMEGILLKFFINLMPQVPKLSKDTDQVLEHLSGN